MNERMDWLVVWMDKRTGVIASIQMWSEMKKHLPGNVMQKLMRLMMLMEKKQLMSCVFLSIHPHSPPNTHPFTSFQNIFSFFFVILIICQSPFLREQ